MLSIRSVLVPTDRSRLSERVYSWAVELAERFRCRIHLLHVASPAGTRRKAPAPHTPYLDRLRALPAELLTEVEITAGSVPKAIITYASENDVDLILMGGRSGRGLASRRLGGVPGPVIRHAPCSVITVRDTFPEHGLRRLLVPVDLSAASRNQLTAAREIAATYGAEIDLLMVLESIGYPATFGIAPMIGLEPELQRRWAERLSEFWEETDGPDVPYNPYLRGGHAGAEIINFTLQQGTDLILIATHGKTGVRRLMLGSVAAQVTRRALCATLIVTTFGKPLIGRRSVEAEVEREEVV